MSSNKYYLSLSGKHACLFFLLHKNLILSFAAQDSEIALLLERKNKEVVDSVAEKHSDMQLALEDAELQRSSAITQLESQKVELQEKIANLEEVCWQQ